MNYSRRYLYILLLLTMPLLFLLSVYLSSSSYIVKHREHEVTVTLYDTTMHIPKKDTHDVKIYLNALKRYTIDQYLIEDHGIVQNIYQIMKHIIFQDTPSDIVYMQPINTTRKYIHFNPFKGELHVDAQDAPYQVNIYLTESTIQLANEHERLSNIKIQSPWFTLIVMPLLSGVTTTIFLFALIAALPLRRHKRPMKTHIALPEYIPIFIFILGAALSTAVVLLIYYAMPGFGDEMNYLIQAKIFLAGKLSIPQPPHPEFFRVDWMDMFGNDGRIWGFHGIGNSIILMIGWLTGVLWITIPVVTGLILVTQYYIALRLCKSKRIALVTVLLMLSSHFFLTLSSSYMAHAPSMLCISLFFLCVILCIQDKNDRFLLPAAASIAFAFDIRPLSALLSAIVPCVALVYHWVRVKKVNSTLLIGSIVLGLAIVSLSYLYTYAITGTFQLAYMVKGPEAGRTITERWQEGWTYRIQNLYQNLNEFQNRAHSATYFFNYIFFLIPLLFWFREKNKLLLAAGYLSLISYTVLHSFLHFYGWKWEPRMLFDVSFLFYLISAYGIAVLYRFARTRAGGTAILITALTMYGFFVVCIDLPARYSGEYYNYGVSPPDIRDYIQKKKLHNAIIFFDNQDIFAPYTIYNSLTFDGDIIYAVSQHNSSDNILIEQYPGRAVYFTPDAIKLEPYREPKI